MKMESKKTKEGMRRKTQSPGLETNHTNEIRKEQKGFHNKEEKSFPNGMTLKKTWKRKRKRKENEERKVWQTPRIHGG
jgi:hypothetical protein